MHLQTRPTCSHVSSTSRKHTQKNHQMRPHKIFSNLYRKCPKCLWSSALVSQPVQHVSSFLVLVKMFLVPNGTGCLIQTVRDCACVESTSNSAQASSFSALVFVPRTFLWYWRKMSGLVFQKIKLELRGIFLLACEFCVGYYILLHMMLTYLTLS